MQINPNETIVLQRSAPRAVMHVFGSLILLMIGIHMVGHAESYTKEGVEVIGWASIVFSGPVLVLLVGRFMTGGTGPITFGPAGFHDPVNGPDLVPWQAIKKITFKKQRYTTLIWLEIESSAFGKLTPPLPTRLIFAYNRACGYPGLGVSASDLAIRPRALWYIVTDYAKAHNPSVEIIGQP